MTGPEIARPATRVPPLPTPLVAWLALGFMLLSLIALLVLPMFVQSRIDALRDQVEQVVEPARAAVTEIQFYLARQMSALRGYMVAGDPSFLDRYAAMVEEEHAIRGELRPLAEGLGPQVLRSLSRLEVISDQWHARAMRNPNALRDPGADPRIEAALYEEILATAAALDEAIGAASRHYQDEIRAAERRSLQLTGGLVLLALAAALAAAWLGRRIRLLADAAAQALEETLGLMEQRSRLLRGITHDVKNPLGAADGYAHLLEAGMDPLTPRQAEWVAGIRRLLGGTFAMIDDLLRLERAGSTDVPIERRPVELGALLQETASEHTGAVEAAGHVMEVVTPKSPVRSWTDADRVRQILRNLVTNAIKYTPQPGTIGLRLDLVDEDAGRARRRSEPGRWAVLRVSDSGPGIPEDHLERIFEEFHRVDPAGPPGHGLGLATSRRIAELLHGRVTVESVPGRGSVFALWLPLRVEGSEDGSARPARVG